MMKMSLILDAIKKSERERQQQEVPGLSANHDEYKGKSKAKNWWVIAVVVLLLIIAYLFFGKIKSMFWEEKSIPEVTQNNPQQPHKIFPVETIVEAQQSLPQNKPSLGALPSKVSDDNKDASNNLKAVSEKNKLKEIISEPKIDNSLQSTSSNQSKIKNVIQLNNELRRQLPTIEFSTHIFTGDQKTSFVVLNDKMLGVGEMLDDDIEILQITKEGIVVEVENKKVFIKALENVNP